MDKNKLHYNVGTISVDDTERGQKIKNIIENLPELLKGLDPNEIKKIVQDIKDLQTNKAPNFTGQTQTADNTFKYLDEYNFFKENEQQGGKANALGVWDMTIKEVFGAPAKDAFLGEASTARQAFNEIYNMSNVTAGDGIVVDKSQTGKTTISLDNTISRLNDNQLFIVTALPALFEGTVYTDTGHDDWKEYCYSIAGNFKITLVNATDSTQTVEYTSVFFNVPIEALEDQNNPVNLLFTCDPTKIGDDTLPHFLTAQLFLNHEKELDFNMVLLPPIVNTWNFSSQGYSMNLYAYRKVSQNIITTQ